MFECERVATRQLACAHSGVTFEQSSSLPTVVSFDVNNKSSVQQLVVSLLRAALVLALVVGVWAVYRGLPDNGVRSFALNGGAGAANETRLRVVLHLPAIAAAQLAEASVQLYPLDLAAAQREFYFERRAGQRFDDFLERQTRNRPPVKACFDARGEAFLRVPPGKWWVYASVPGRDEVTSWRLPVNVSGREQTTELTAQNAYTRTKSF